MAEEAVDYAREQVAKLIGAIQKRSFLLQVLLKQIIWLLKGCMKCMLKRQSYYYATEHKAVLDTCKHIEKLGGEVTYLKVTEDGLIDLKELEAAMRPTTILIAIMYAKNEIGIVSQ